MTAFSAWAVENVAGRGRGALGAGWGFLAFLEVAGRAAGGAIFISDSKRFWDGIEG